MSQYSICRLCGVNKQQNDIISDLNEIQEENLTLRDYITFYCRVELKKHPDLSSSVCRVCRLILETFTAFCDNLSKVEKKNCLNINPEHIAKMEEIKPEVKEEVGLDGITKKLRKPREKSHILSVIELYRELLAKPFLQLEKFSHITISPKHLSSEGEVSNDWLKDYNFKTWKDFNYKCLHCKKNFKSLKVLLNHFNEIAMKCKISCTHDKCSKVFASVNSYLNHVIKYHQEFLAYSCTDCGGIFYNISCLIQHYARDHPLIRDMFPCIECGYYATGFTQLKVHTMTHKTQEVSDDEEPPVKKQAKESIVASTSKIVRTGKEENKSQHPKAVKRLQLQTNSSSKARPKFECDECDRVLLTKQGYDYHKLVHANIKPFICHLCQLAFRSKQACDEHTKTCK